MSNSAEIDMNPIIEESEELGEQTLKTFNLPNLSQFNGSFEKYVEHCQTILEGLQNMYPESNGLSAQEILDKITKKPFQSNNLSSQHGTLLAGRRNAVVEYGNRNLYVAPTTREEIDNQLPPIIEMNSSRDELRIIDNNAEIVFDSLNNFD